MLEDSVREGGGVFSSSNYKVSPVETGLSLSLPGAGAELAY